MAFWFILGFIASLNIEFNNFYNNNNTNSNLVTFFYAFSKVYWYLFICYIIIDSRIGFFIFLFIVFYKSLLDGIALGIYIRNLGMMGFITYIKYYFSDFILILPVFLNFYTYKLGINTSGRKSREFNLVVITIVAVLYGIIACFIS